MNLVLTPLRIDRETSGKRTMYFEPKTFYKLIRNNPDALITIADEDGNEIRTFNARPLWEGLFSDRRLD
jgi:ABC-type Fe3+-citrate transport system substrate-binding protein